MLALENSCVRQKGNIRRTLWIYSLVLVFISVSDEIVSVIVDVRVISRHGSVPAAAQADAHSRRAPLSPACRE